jgi:phospholipid transport system substrate-binding protein
MRAWMMVCLSLLLLSASPANAGFDADARSLVQSLGNEVITAIEEQKSVEVREKELRRIFESYVDVPWVAKFVLGIHWRKASEAQQQAYMEAYAPYLARTYARRFSEYTGEELIIRQVTANSDRNATVSALISRPNQEDVVVQFRVGKRRDGAVKVLDIVVEGVSQLSTQRSEFNTVINREGLDYLISQLKGGQPVAQAK